MKKINSNILNQFRTRYANLPDMQAIMDLWKESGWAGGIEEKITWMGTELGISRNQAIRMIQDYAQQIAAKGRTQLQKQREDKLQQYTEQAKRDIANPNPNLPPLPEAGKTASYKSIIIKNSKIRLFKNKYANIDPRTSSFGEKINIILDFVEKFPSARSAAEHLISEAKKLLDIITNQQNQGSIATASVAKQALSLSGVVGKISNFLWIITALALYGAAGTSDYISKFGSQDGASEVKAFLIFLTALGSAVLSSVLYKFIMDKNNTKPQPQTKSLYEGFNR